MRNIPPNSSNGRRRSAEWFERRDLDGFLHRSWLKSTGVTRRDVPRAAGDRDLQQLERARQLQRPPARARRVGQARRAAGGRLPARVPGDLARRVADEADDDALPEPHGDGRRGVDPRLPARRRRPADGLRQDEPGEHHGRGERRHPGDRRHRRADAERALARARDRLVQRLLALPRGAARRAHHGGRVGRDRELDVALERPLHDDGHRVDDGLRHGGARAHAARRRGDPGRRLPPTPPRRGGRSADRGARGRATSSRRDILTREAFENAIRVLHAISGSTNAILHLSPTPAASASSCRSSCSTSSARRRRGSSTSSRRAAT